MGKLLNSAIGNARQIVSAVCHGPSVFETLTFAGKDKPLKNIKATGFSDVEELAIPHNLTAPETTLKELGADYSKAENPWAPYVVSSGITSDGKAKFITGQNPAY